MAVVMFHYTTRYSEMYGHRSPLPFEFRYGNLGVELFFGISGFVIFMTLDRTKSLTDFVVSRASRLFPAYWTAILFTTIAVNTAGMNELTRSPWEVAINATMLQHFLGVAPVDGVYWTLAVELTFYGAMALLWKLGALRNIEPILLTWMSLTWVWAFSPSVLGGEPSWLLGSLIIQEHIPYFAIGMAAYRLKSGVGDRRWIGAVFGVALVTIGVCDELSYLVVALVSTAVLTAIAFGKVPALAAKPLVWGGTISYSLYLLHESIGFAILKKLESAGAAPALSVAVTVGAMVALAAGVTYLVERPALRAAKRWHGIRRTRRDSPIDLRAEPVQLP